MLWASCAEDREGVLRERRAVLRLGLLAAAAAGVLAFAPGTSTSGRPPGLAGPHTSAETLFSSARVVPVRHTEGGPHDPVRASVHRAVPGQADPGHHPHHHHPHHHPHHQRSVVDPGTGGPVPVDGARGVVPDVDGLGPVHVDPLPPGVRLSDPVDTDSLLARADRGEPADSDVPPSAAAATAPAGTPPGTSSVTGLTAHVAPSCSGTGTDGNRVQPMYVHETGAPSRLSSVLSILRNEVANVDDTVAVSARQTGGERRVRWVHDGRCVPKILDVTVPAGALGSDFWGTVSAVKSLGYDDPHRKYLMFADANRLCGIGSVYDDTRPTGNSNDGRYASYSRVDANCWSTRSSVPAHELTHNLGGVLGAAPHATVNGHCYDDADLMCYDDGSGVAMKKVCAAAQEQLLDCNHDDYFSTAPAPGSFLAKNWNTASSSFLDAVAPEASRPDVSVSASTGAARTGDDVRFTATSSRTVIWAWSTSAAGSPCRLASDAGSATLRCPSTVTGTVRVTATATETGTAAAGSGTADVVLSRANAPTATMSAPADAAEGTEFPVSVSPTGTAPFGYAWKASSCSVTAPARASTTVSCPTGITTQDLVVSVLVTQADGQSVQVAEPVHVTGTGPPSAPVPTGTSWSPPSLSSTGTLASVLRTASGRVLVDRAVALEAQWFGTSTWVRLDSVRTDASGRASSGTSYGRAARLRFASPRDSSYEASHSTSVFVKVRTRSTVSKPARHRVAGVLRSATGVRLGGEPITLQRRRSGTLRWVPVTKLRTDAQGAVSRAVHPRHRTYFRWVFPGSSEQRRTHSSALRFR